MDIPSLGNIIQTCKQTQNSLFSDLITDDQNTWANLVTARFGIKTGSSKRPKSYGAPTWKAVYHTLMCANKIPKCRLLTGEGKVVFAKPVFGNSLDETSSLYVRTSKKLHNTSKRSSKERKKSNGINLWVSVGHTPDCNTRRAKFRNWNAMSVDDENELHRCTSFKSASDIPLQNRYQFQRDREVNISNLNQRFIELHLCLQNSKSSNGVLHVDFSEAFVQMVGPASIGHKICNVQAKNFGKYKPKLLYYSGDGEDHRSSKCSKSKTSRKKFHFTHPQMNINIARTQSCHEKLLQMSSVNKNSKKEKKRSSPHQLSLLPFEFAVVAVNIPCTSDMIYETDFLARCLLLHVPITLDTYIPHRIYSVSNPCQGTSKRKQPEHEHILQWEKQKKTILASASFLTEMEVWDYYMELPGHCLVLSDIRRLHE